MKHIYIIISFVFIIIITGCGTNNNELIEKPEKILDDFEVQVNIEDKINNLELLPTTIDMYKNGFGSSNEYTDMDKILLGINSKLFYESSNEFYITNDEISNYVYQTLGNTSIKYDNIDIDLKKYSDNTYYVNKELPKSTVISYIDKITYKNNIYHALVYVGVIEDDGIYGDFNKENMISVLTYNNKFNETEKNKYMKFLYEFKTIDNNKYVFSNLKRIYD